MGGAYQPEFIKQYWFGMTQESDWKAGASWAMKFTDGRIADAGEILEVDPPRRAVIKWRNEFRPELAAEGWALCTYEIAAEGEVCKLTVRHGNAVEKDSKFIEAVSGGWPKILSSLKSLLETGAPLPRPG
ncbi:MAG: SRPBCC domain-containing protein [Rhizomicrobium sp.]